MFALIDLAAEPAPVVFDAEPDGFTVLTQFEPGALRMGVAQAVGERLAGNLQDVDLLAGR
ncbi:hypothetical protein D3C85_1931180 [compost metagenome]